VMELLRQNIRPRDILTKEALMNALTVDMALGCSTNSMLHLPAIAHECGVDLNLDIANEISAKTPNLCHLAPAGRTYMEDLNEAGGVYAVMNELIKIGLLHTECMTVTGKTIGENIAMCVNLNPDVIRPIDNPFSETGGIAVLKGNLAPEGSVVKRSAVLPEMLVLEGSVTAKAYNVVIYATSNRRHIIKETFSDRKGEDIHRNDTMQELVSLSERFGIHVTFSKPNKETFLNIVRHLAEENGVDMQTDELDLLAERFALERGGRSARLAKQFIDGLLAR